MYLIETVPLTKIPVSQPQILSYFSAHRLAVGSLISVPLGRRFENAVVIETHELKSHKMEIKDAGYELKPVKRILSPEPILTEKQIKLALWLGEYYFASAGLFLKMMTPKKMTRSVILSSALRDEGSLVNMSHKKQKLILVPTLAQTDQIAKNFPKNKPVIIHSGLPSKQFDESWQKIANNKARIVIGTRLALFAPFCGLKEIAIYDETNPSHRSWDMYPHYRTHEIAQKLSELFGAKLMIKSSLPSIESHFFYSSPIPSISPISPTIIDLRAELKDGNFSIFSRHLQQAIRETLHKKQQIILFINRRGAGTFVLCRDCGYVAKCQNCDAPLTYHLTRLIGGQTSVKITEVCPPIKLKPVLLCHHCGARSEPPSLCPKCQSHRIKAFGTGSQRVEQEAQKLFKDAKILRLDSDTAQDTSQQNKIMEEFKQKKADILIGTQMILAADAPKVPLVAIISGDTLMHLPDFRSDERLFKTITQLKNLLLPSGSLNLIIQTHNPKNKILQMAADGNYEQFYENEIEARKILKYPPFSQLVKLVFWHRDPHKAASDAKILCAKLTQQLKTSNILKEVILEISDASPAFIAKKKGRYAWQIIIKSSSPWLAPKDKRDEILKIRNRFLIFVPPGWEIDVDPETLL